MNAINKFTITTTPKLNNDIALRKTIIEEKLASKCKEYNRLVEMKEASQINEFKARMYNMITSLNAEIEDLKETLASFYKNIY